MARTHPLEHLEAIIVVGIGGFAGSNLRYFVDLVIPHSLAATASVNLLGSFALGVLIYEELFKDSFSNASRTLIATGFIASFTTYSTFVIDALTSSPVLAIGYVIGSYTSGFGAVLFGREVARWVLDVTPPAREEGD